jgi:hypothetical protein
MENFLGLKGAYNPLAPPPTLMCMKRTTNYGPAEEKKKKKKKDHLYLPHLHAVHVAVNQSHTITMTIKQVSRYNGMNKTSSQSLVQPSRAATRVVHRTEKLGDSQILRLEFSRIYIRYHGVSRG